VCAAVFWCVRVCFLLPGGAAGVSAAAVAAIFVRWGVGFGFAVPCWVVRR